MYLYGCIQAGRTGSVHLAQALCYGWFYSTQNELETIGIQITYCNIETEEIRRFKEARSFEELKAWFEG